MKITRMRSRVPVLAIAILLLLPISPALAEQEGAANVIFTKWVTTLITSCSGVLCVNMAGLVSGDVGGGTFAGEATILSSDADTTVIDAFYHINGGDHQFTAHNLVTQDNTTNTAVIQGVVTSGWLIGAKVDGGYQVITSCGIINAQQGVGGDTCFQGTLHVHGGGGSGK